MEEKIKGIISTFIKISPEQIGPATPIGRPALGSSILLHRMFAKLAEEGITVSNYADVKVFGDIWPRGAADRAAGGYGADRATGGNIGDGNAAHGNPAAPAFAPMAEANPMAGVGLDIEAISALPQTNDFRTDEFYTMNFTAREMAHCILQADAYASFAGLFAAKEAILKAGGPYREWTFNRIEITHSPEGKPLHPGFELSLSHAAGMAAAVAIAAGRTEGSARVPAAVETKQHGTPAGTSVAAWLALLLAAVTLLIVLIRLK